MDNPEIEPDDLRDGGDQYSSFEPTELAAGKPDQMFTARMRVESTGTHDLGAFNISVYASVDTTITTRDYYLGQTSALLTTGAFANLTVRCTFPTSVPEGIYYIGWIIDPANQVAEDDETNNAACKATPRLKVISQSKPTISGYVRTTEGAGVGEATISADNGGGSTTTDSSGHYTLPVLSGWSGRVAVAKGGFASEPGSRSYTNVASGLAGQDYVLQSLVIFVDLNAWGANNGSSWKNAFTSLQDGLSAARHGGEIRVAEGLYTPDRGTGFSRGDRAASFELAGGVALLGGYAGMAEPNPDARDIKTYPTILSGDLLANDPPLTEARSLSSQSSRQDNSRHVVMALNAEQVILDGLQIVGGYANGSSGIAVFPDDSQGAGLYIRSGSLRLRGCSFAGNWAAGDGGAIYAVDSPCEWTDCTFRTNAAGVQTHGTGGAIRTEGNTQMSLLRCTFSGNFAAAQGGALDNDQGTLQLAGCRFIQNAAGSAGGGAIWNSQGKVSAANCIFNGNTSAGAAGAISNGYRATLLAANCLLHANYAKTQAGALDNFAGSKATLSNCTLAANRQDTYPGAVVCGPALDQGICELSIINSILWNGGAEIWNRDKSPITVVRTNIQGGWSGIGNLNAPPLFVLPAGLDGMAGTDDDDLRLSTGSPGIDRGDSTLLPEDFADLDADGDTREPWPLDLNGKARTGGLATDMGAYETPCAGL